MSSVLQEFSVAFVVPRYGADIGGGAETLVRELAEKAFIECMPNNCKIVRKEVWTTCARDHRTWENELAEGQEFINGVLIRRFSVDPRNLEPFIEFEMSLRERNRTNLESQLSWLRSGVNSSGLYSHIATNGEEFDFIFYAPYLFPLSFWGPLIFPNRSILIPCLHDEGYAYLDCFRVLFNQVLGFLFNAEPEAQLADSLYSKTPGDICNRGATIGMGFDQRVDPKLCKTEPIENPFILYSGRKETGKNLDFLLNCFSEYKDLNPNSELELKIIGSGEIDFIDELPRGCLDLGFVSEEDKCSLMRNALFLCQPSVNESFSIVLMESWLAGTPVLVSAQCAVTNDHVLRSGGGLVFSTSEEFSKVTDFFLENIQGAKVLGEAGRDYVQRVYSWESIRERLSKALLTFKQLQLDRELTKKEVLKFNNG